MISLSGDHIFTLNISREIWLWCMNMESHINETLQTTKKRKKCAATTESQEKQHYKVPNVDKIYFFGFLNLRIQKP